MRLENTTFVLSFCLVTACISSQDKQQDLDGDGLSAPADCDDADPDTYIGALEQCDGVDNDCNGVVDDRPSDGSIYFEDADGDGFGSPDSTVSSCTLPSGYVEDASDCDDSEATVFPGALELCNLVDDDCDLEIDEDATDSPNWYEDADGDGYGNPVSWYAGCDPPSGYVLDNSDCDDTNADLNPGTSWYDDSDYDGFGDPDTLVEGCTAPWGHVHDGTDCDDDDSGIHPGATEWCNGVNDDCDSTTSEHGLVSRVSADGTWSDLTLDFGVGTSGQARDVPISTEGETWLCGGTWYVEFDVQADHIMGSPEGASMATLHGDPSGSLVRMTTDGVDFEMQRLILSNGTGSATNSSTRQVGGAILCDAANTTLDLVDSVLTGNTSEEGGAIYIEGCDLNTTTTAFENNEATLGAAISTRGNTYLTFVDSTFSNNAAGTSGGALFLDETTSAPGDVIVQIIDTQIFGNTAQYGGGIWMDSAEVTCAGSTTGSAGIWGNTADYYGGGVRMWNSEGTVFTSSICDFGVSGSSEDNSPNDLQVYQGEAYAGYNDDESFTCTSLGGCR